jgi:hypothetical protein
MSMFTADHDVSLASAVRYFYGHGKTVSAQKAALLFGVNHSTLSRRINGTIRSRSHGGQNKLLTATQETAVLGYAREQANAGFRCAEQMVTRAVTRVRALQHQPTPSNAWTMQFMRAHPELKKPGIKPIAKMGASAQDIADTFGRWFNDFGAELHQPTSR